MRQVGTFLDYDRNPSFEEADVVVFGVSFDKTSSYTKGSRMGPDAIFYASWQTEFEPGLISQKKMTETLKIHNKGILEPKTSEEMNFEVKKLTTESIGSKKLMIFGGEHSICNGVWEALADKYNPKECAILQIDAHLDLRDSLENNKYSHGSVMRRAKDLGFEIYSVGIRDQISSEEAKIVDMEKIWWCSTYPTELQKGKIINEGNLSLEQIKEITQKLSQHKHTWVTIDIDGFDSAIMPGTGTPMPNGLTLETVNELMYKLSKKIDIIGFDIVEVQPQMKEAGEYHPDKTINTVTEMNTALLAYRILYYNFKDKF